MVDASLLRSISTPRAPKFVKSSTATAFSPTDPTPEATRPLAIHALAMTPTRLIGGLSDGSLVIWNLYSGDLLCRLKREHDDGIAHIAILECEHFPDAAYFVTASFDGTLRLYEMMDQRPRRGSTLSQMTVKSRMSVHGYTSERGEFRLRLLKILRGHQRDVYCAALDMDGQKTSLKDLRVVSGSADRTVRIWQPLQQTQQTLQGHTETVTCVAICGDLIASGSLDKSVRCMHIYCRIIFML
jgi:WD40 repeat protein